MVKDKEFSDDEFKKVYQEVIKKWLPEPMNKKKKPLEAIPYEQWVVDKLNEISVNQEKANAAVSSKGKIMSTTLNDIFIESDYEKYLEPLCLMEKPLLKRNKDKSYAFLRGKSAICRYFYHDLKDIALKPKTTQEDISNALFNGIKDFGTKPNRNSYNESFIYTDLQKHIPHKN